MSSKITPIYRSGANGSVRLYGGPFKLTKGGATWTANGDLVLENGLGGLMYAHFAGQDSWIADAILDELPVAEVANNANLAPPSGSVAPEAPAEGSWGQCQIPVNQVKVGDISSANRVVLNILGESTTWNLPIVDVPDGTQQQVQFSLNGWDVRIAPIEGDPLFAFVAEATPATLPMSERMALSFFRQMFILIKLIGGDSIGLGPRAAVDESGVPVWVELGAGRVGKIGHRWCRSDMVAEALPAIAAGMTELSRNPGLTECVDRAIGLLMAADGPGTLDVRIPMTCSGLEVLSWAILQHQQWLNSEDIAKLSAGSRARLLMQWASIPVEIPIGFAGMESRRSAIGRADWTGPDTLFNVRNGLVHPPKRLSDPEWPKPDELYDAWRLGTWYLELAILRAVNYKGQYVSRLQAGSWVGASEPVPWVAT